MYMNPIILPIVIKITAEFDGQSQEVATMSLLDQAKSYPSRAKGLFEGVVVARTRSNTGVERLQWIPEVCNRLKELLNQGVSHEKIAEALGVRTVVINSAIVRLKNLGKI